MSEPKHSIKKLLGWLISLLFLALVFYKVEWSAFVRALSELQWYDFPILMFLYLLGYPVRAIRSKVLLPKLQFSHALGGVFVGYAANNLLPARLGELVRAQIVGIGSGIKRTTVFSNILIERILDGAAIVALLWWGSYALQLPEGLAQVRMVGLILFTVALLGIAVVGLSEKYWEKWIPPGRTGAFLHGLLEGAALATRSVSTVMMTIILSVAVWMVETLQFYYGMHAFGFELNYLNAAFVLGLTNLGVLIPSSPGNLGVFQYFAVSALIVCGVTTSAASAYAVVIHLAQYIPVTIIGLMFLPHFGFRSIFDLKAVSKPQQA